MNLSLIVLAWDLHGTHDVITASTILQTVEKRAFGHILPRHIPASTVASSEHQLSVDIFLLESVSIIQLKRQLPLLAHWLHNDPNWCASLKWIVHDLIDIHLN